MTALATTDQETSWESTYRPWRHGGWYTDARYPNGASGCVSNNYDDKKWRIACSHFGLTFSTRGDAAKAERAMTLAMHDAEAVKTELLAAIAGLLDAVSDLGDEAREEFDETAVEAAINAVAKAKK